MTREPHEVAEDPQEPEHPQYWTGYFKALEGVREERDRWEREQQEVAQARAQARLHATACPECAVVFDSAWHSAWHAGYARRANEEQARNPWTPFQLALLAITLFLAGVVAWGVFTAD